MADLTKIFGGAFTPQSGLDVAPDPPDQQIINAIMNAGMDPPEQIIMDGKVHRFNSGTNGKTGGGKKSGWYVIFSDGIPAGRFGCWRADISMKWRADIGRELSAAEEMQHARRMAEAARLRDEERKKEQSAVANTAENIWDSAAFATEDHPYLQKKGIQPHGARVTGDGRLIVPLYDSDGALCSLQYIGPDGDKKYQSGGKTGESFWWIGEIDKGEKIYIAEGFATAATIHETTESPVVIAYSASNIPKVAALFQNNHKVIVADNDASGVGQKYADQAAAKYGAVVIIPPIEGDANDYAKSGGDLAALLNPVIDDWLISADDFSAKPAPLSWLIKRWLQDNALIMVHGPSGAGKTFVLLDWLLRIAGNIDSWSSLKVKNAPVVYLAGEGHHGLKGRIAAWKQHHGVNSVNMWVSKGGCDLNTPEGYFKVVEQIRCLPETPKVIAVDTLHRFLDGDENSSQDAKTMLDYCAKLMAEFNCTVILVHHTGVSEEAQHRARGSSAWRGALDIEISVLPGKQDGPIEIVQRKSKDAELAEPVYVDLQPVAIDGWMDEDGEAVTSAVTIEAEKPVKKESKQESNNASLFSRAWFDSGCEIENDSAYISRSAMIDFMINNLNKTESTAQRYCAPSSTKGFVAEMIADNTISPYQHGWICINPELNGQLMLKINLNQLN